MSLHPKLSESGREVQIMTPHTEFVDLQSPVSTFVPSGYCPKIINGISTDAFRGDISDLYDGVGDFCGPCDAKYSS